MKLLAVLAVIYPLIIALILILIGVLLHLRRTKMGINTTGVVVGTAKIAKKMTKLKMSVEAPVVRYTVKGREYTCTASKFRMDSTQTYYKGEVIDIRVNKKDPHKFEPLESCSTAEKLLITGGVFIIIAFGAVYIKYRNIFS